MFKIVCAWCEKTIKEGIKGAPISHLICPLCYEREMRLLAAELATVSENNQPQTAPQKVQEPVSGQSD